MTEWDIASWPKPLDIPVRQHYVVATNTQSPVNAHRDMTLDVAMTLNVINQHITRIHFILFLAKLICVLLVHHPPPPMTTVALRSPPLHSAFSARGSQGQSGFVRLVAF